MIAYLILGVSLLFGALLLSRWFVSANPSQVKKALIWTLAILGVIGGLFLLFAGRQALASLAILFLLPLLRQLPMLIRRWKAASGPSAGQASTVETQYFRMTLDHDTGEMDGVVREGPQRGEKLSELDLETLIELWREARAEDERSASVLEAYLDRTHEGWREAAGAPGAGESAGEGSGEGARTGAGAGAGGAAAAGPMTKEQAREILGVSAAASREEILGAYRKLMQKLHPDHGGSNFLAAQINQAKRVLIGE
ncbi:MAG: DnaJ domain-containing protein [Rhodovibrionaceae bacterium]|nr:DnaJ domain-containing protein [Rhodovibrionaceae bacterium]